ncbi:MAG: aldehyde dehydrogenase family protein [Ilumatobacteraceae bacterium]
MTGTATYFDPTSLHEIAQRAMDWIGAGDGISASSDSRARSSVSVRSPIIGRTIGSVSFVDDATITTDVDDAVGRATSVFAHWRSVPAPRRGEVVRHLGDELRRHKDALADLVQIEVGKIRSEALGEVQEMIDICDFAVGLSRQLHGLTISSERPGHRLAETWQPLGPVGVISAFNFPVAVWSWNAALALICGDTVVWKPSDATPLCSLATTVLARRAAITAGFSADVCQLVFGDASVGRALASDHRVPLISATGSTRMGRLVAPIVAERFGRSILELGGNNAAIVAPSADLDLVVRGVTFAAAGTAGQRCTSLRRLIVHSSRVDEVVDRIGRAYTQLRVGNPMSSDTLVGPLIDEKAGRAMTAAIEQAVAEGGRLVVGGERCLADAAPDAAYMRPAIVTMPRQTEIVRTETFAPILYVMSYETMDEAIAIQNDVPQGLASSIFTTDLREAERFTGPAGSDCGIANVNIGPSGAEIGGAFGGEKETGGGRESGSDAWKAYMRRQTQTINYSNDLPLAQGVVFE